MVPDPIHPLALGKRFLVSASQPLRARVLLEPGPVSTQALGWAAILPTLGLTPISSFHTLNPPSLSPAVQPLARARLRLPPLLLLFHL